MDSLFAKMYEDWSAGRITEYNFQMLSAKYQQEQAELDAKIQALKAALDTAKQSDSNAKQWIQLIRQYSHITELTAPLLNTLIEIIIVHDATKEADGTKTQEVEIFYRFVGKID